VNLAVKEPLGCKLIITDLLYVTSHLSLVSITHSYTVITVSPVFVLILDLDDTSAATATPTVQCLIHSLSSACQTLAD